MKLIDLDKVRWEDGFYDMRTGEQFAPMMFNTPEWLEWATAEAKVKAIPIEWLMKKADEWATKDITYDGKPFTAQQVGLAIASMVIDWEKENERV